MSGNARRIITYPGYLMYVTKEYVPLRLVQDSMQHCWRDETRHILHSFFQFLSCAV